jgi:hypothetical protein
MECLYLLNAESESIEGEMLAFYYSNEFLFFSYSSTLFESSNWSEMRSELLLFQEALILKVLCKFVIEAVEIVLGL